MPEDEILEYLRRSGRNLADGAGKAADWLAGGARHGLEPVMGLLRGDALDEPLMPTADGGGRIGALASALTAGHQMRMSAPQGALGAIPFSGDGARAAAMARLLRRGGA